MTSTMLQEIREQPAALARTLAALEPVRPELARLVRDVERVTLYGRGTSDAAAGYGRYLLEIHAELPACLGAPSVGTLYRAEPPARGSLAVLVSQSGSTGELVETAQWARRCGAKVLAVTNTAGSDLAAAADLALVTAAGPELAVPATKTYTAQLLALAVLAAAFRPLDLTGVPAAAQAVLADPTDRQVGEAAQVLVPARAVVVAARGLLLGTATELALKLQETCGLAAIGMSTADLQHGPVAMLGPQVPVIVLAAAAGPTAASTAALVEAARERGAPVVLLSSAAAGLPELLAPIVAVIPGQRLVEATAVARGDDPDAPHLLTKVTQTR